MGTICMKCRILYSGENKNVTNLLSAELANRVVKVKDLARMTPKVVSLTDDFIALPRRYAGEIKGMP